MGKYPGKSLPVPKAKDGKKRIGNLLYADWWNQPEAVYQKITRMLNAGMLVTGPQGKLTVKLSPDVLHQPWYFIKSGINRQCVLWHDIYFDEFKFIPRHCLEKCWKTVISVDTVLELFKLRDILIKLQLPSKCGIDVRTYSYNVYDGFIYGDTLGQGQRYYEIIRDALKHTIPKARIILKRGCTEFEQEFPDSKKWGLSEENMLLEHFLDAILEPPPIVDGGIGMQGGFATCEVFQIWIKYAHGIRDRTWRDAMRYEGYDPPKHLYPPPNTYHNMSEEDLSKL